MSYFPMYVDLKQQKFLVVGGGNIACHKIKVLLDFEANVKVVAPKICDEILENVNVHSLQKEYESTDLDGVEFVVIATDDKKRNHQIAKECEAKHLMYNTVDHMENCKFIFPSYVKKKDIVIGISSGGNSPYVTQFLKKKIENLLTNELVQMTEMLGALRPRVKEEVKKEADRKKVYQKLFEIFLKENKIPEEHQIQKTLETIKYNEVSERKLDD